MTGRIYEEHNGRCVCEIHRQFLAATGETVDQYYERTGREPWYMKTCCKEPGCGPNWLGQDEQPEPITITSPRTAPAPMQAELHPHVSSEKSQSGQTQPAPTTCNTVYTSAYQENEPMCNPFNSQSACSDHCAREQAAIAANRRIIAIGTTATLLLALAAISFLTFGVFGLAFAVVFPCVYLLALALKNMGTIADWLIDLAALPFIWLVDTMRHQPAADMAYTVVEQPTQHLLPAPIKNPAQLLGVREVETIELPAQAQPEVITVEPMAQPAKARKVKVK